MFLPGGSHGQRSVVGCSPWGHESQTRLSGFAGTLCSNRSCLVSYILALTFLALTALFGSRDSRCCCVCVCVCACVRVCSGGWHRHVSVLRLLPLVQALCAAPGEQGTERSKSQALPSPLRARVLRRWFSLFSRLSANALACYETCLLLL